MDHNDWFLVDNMQAVDTPALLVYRERAANNIRLITEMVPDIRRLRPHVKTHKMAEITRMMMDAGIKKFKCATIAEAEMLAMSGAPDVLLAYQPIGPKIYRLIALVSAYPQSRFACLIDNAETAAEISAAALEAGVLIKVFIDLNSGMNRSGILPEKAVALYKHASTLRGIRITGLHAYDGHVREKDRAERQQKSDEAFQKIENIVAEINILAKEKLTVVVGGSPSFPTHMLRKDVECSPGTFVFWDHGYKEQLPDEPFDYAALVATRIISVIDEQTVCLDLGHKAIAAENPLPRVFFLNAPDAMPVSQSEEHMVLRVSSTQQYHPGDVFYGAPVHICPTVALYDSAFIISNHKVVDEWRITARGRKITI